MHDAVERVQRGADRATGRRRWSAALGHDVDDAMPDISLAGRITVAFHPDRAGPTGETAAQGLLAAGRYRNQWETGASSGHRSAIPGGPREQWEQRLFGPLRDVPFAERPIYGAFDLLSHRHGGSPAFGSCFLVLRDHVRDRCTLTLGDSHLGPSDVGTFGAPEAVLAGLAEQAAAHDLLGRGLDTADLLDLLAGGEWPDAPRSLEGYVEAQVHGGIRLATDVEAIVADPSFRDSPTGGDLGAAAEAHGVALRWHPGTSLDVAMLDHPDAAHDLPDDWPPGVPETLRRLADDDGTVDAARVGTLVAGHRFVAPSADGDPQYSPLQLVKRAWRSTYLLGRDAEGDDRPA